MTIKNFRILRIIISALLAIATSISVMTNNYILAIIAISIAITVSLIARRTVKEVIADERDYQISGKSAVLAMNIFSIIASIISLALMFQRYNNPTYLIVGHTLAYSTCALMLLYSFIFKYYAKQD